MLNSEVSLFQHDVAHKTDVLHDGNKLSPQVAPCKWNIQSTLDANTHLDRSVSHKLQCHLPSLVPYTVNKIRMDK